MKESVESSPNDQYNVMKIARLKHVEVLANYANLWEQIPPPKLCWKKPSPKLEGHSLGFILFSLKNGPEYHASQVSNAIHVARHLGATLVLPDIRGNKVGEKRNFAEVYDVNKFMSSLDGVVHVVKKLPTEIYSTKITTIRVPGRVSELFILTKIGPLFKTRRSLRLVTQVPSSKMVKKIKKWNTAPHECMAMFQALDLRPELKQLASSMVQTLRSLSQKTSGQFIAIDLRKDMMDKIRYQKNTSSETKRCRNAEEISQFLRKIGVHNDTTIYITQSRWNDNLSALREIFPYTFTKDAIMPMDGKARFMDAERSQVEDLIDLHICTESDIFVPAHFNQFYANVVGKKIASGNSKVLVPLKKASTSVGDYISPFITKKSHQAYSCLC
ncbi:hypothetical protein Leryth_010408 [Lithospermum erythrorhizon]|nr:hypothetical protein Leryth_010408 [Lithospermum erythrorhizon]